MMRRACSILQKPVDSLVSPPALRARSLWLLWICLWFLLSWCLSSNALVEAQIDQAQATTTSEQQTTTTTTTTTADTSTTTVAPALRRAKLLFGGDVLTHTSVIRQACIPNQPCNFDRLLASTASLVSSADLAVCHLEVPIVGEGQRVSGYPTFGAPPALAGALARTGWDHCSTASNHSLDRGIGGINSTIRALDAVGVTHAGTFARKEDADFAFVRDVNGIKIAHLAATYGLNGLRLSETNGWRIRRINVEALVDAARTARTNGADVVMVSLHWGNEYQHQPTKAQMRIAEALTASDAFDLVVGHHAHVVQPIRNINQRWVIFGLGNHISGQVPVGRKLATQDGMLVEVQIREESDGRFTLDRPVVHPTWNQPRSHRVYVVDQRSNNAAANLSRERTLRVTGAAFAAVSEP